MDNKILKFLEKPSKLDSYDGSRDLGEDTKHVVNNMFVCQHTMRMVKMILCLTITILRAC